MSSPRTVKRAQRNRHARAPKPITRSASEVLLGAIKNIVQSPLAWFNTHDNFESTPNKRRRDARASPPRESGDWDEGASRAKRKRVRSPSPEPPPSDRPPEVQSGQHTKRYLDMPESMVRAPAAPRQGQHAPSHARSSSLAVPPSRRFGRHTHSPGPRTSTVHASAIARTQSMDPPAMRDLSMTRGFEMEIDGDSRSSSMRDVTMSPTRTRFAMRQHTSLTPQPDGQAFGPAPVRRQRDPSEPPPLQALMSNPIFVKPPPVSSQHELLQQPTLTLGTLVETQRRTLSPVRQHSALTLGSRSSSEMVSSDSLLRPINAAEKALHDLDVYKTPLLPSRLRGSTTIPEMFQPKKTKLSTLIRKDKDEKPRLGTTERKQDKGIQSDVKDGASLKPYAGQGGMKKLLARRRKEEADERDQPDASEVHEQDDPVESQGIAADAAAQLEASLDTLPAPSEFTPRNAAGREQSSLRVGRSRNRDRHAPSVQISRPKNKFSAVYEEDEDDRMVGVDEGVLDKPKDLGAPPPPPPKIEVPAGFTFAKPAAPVKQDVSDAKEPPIAALPFSFGKPALSVGDNKSTDVPASTAASSLAPPTISTTSAFGALAPTPATPSVPSISLIPPTPNTSVLGANPESSKSTEPAATSGSSVPNFFANSAIFSKPGVGILPPPVVSGPLSFGLAPAAEVPDKTSTAEGSQKDDADGAPKAPRVSAFGAPAKPSPFGGVSQPSSAPVFGTPASATSASPFGSKAESPAATSLFGGPAPGKEAGASSATSLFGTPSSVTPPVQSPLQTSPFSFGAPPKPAEQPSNVASTQPFSFGAPAKPSSSASTESPVLTFGAQKTEIAQEPKPTEDKSSSTLQPSLFGNTSATGSLSPSPSFSGFGPSAGTEASKSSAFVFGQPSPATTTAPAAEAASSAPVLEAPKPSVPSGGFSFGQPALVAPTTPIKSPLSPFSFGAAPSTPPAATTEKPAFTFGTPTPTAPTSVFGGPTSGSNGADVSTKPFAFGATTTPRGTVTPPRADQEVSMDESPTRGMDVNTEKPSTGGFSFGTPSTSIFGQNNQSAPSTSNPFNFGAPSGASNPFAPKTEVKQEIKAEHNFGGFGQTTSTGFGFGQKAASSAQSPVSTSPFGFGQASTTPTSTPTGAFSFGAPSTGTSAFNPPTSANGSTPSSPSTFNQPSPFAFGTPTSTTAPSNPFNFGSQPASPANANPGLPQASTTPTAPFTFGQSSATATSASPFGAPAAASPTEGALFTIGAASAPAPGARVMRKLPTRRGLKR